MKPFQQFSAAAIAVAAIFMCAGCEGDFASDASSPRPTRAVGVPVERNSALGEMNSGKEIGTPVLSVDLPNTKTDQPHVHTIADPLMKPPATQPAPAGQNPATRLGVPAMIQPGRGGDPINGPGE